MNSFSRLFLDYIIALKLLEIMQKVLIKFLNDVNFIKMDGMYLMESKRGEE